MYLDCRAASIRIFPASREFTKTLKYGKNIAEEDCGIPCEHSQAFLSVARETNTAIASRSVGVYATQLIREGYATKGYHVKAKSCDWGPMAGFVLADPALGKKGTSSEAVSWQLGKINDAIRDGAQSLPLYISDRRKVALPRLMMKNSKRYLVSEKAGEHRVQANAKDGRSHEFILVEVGRIKTEYRSNNCQLGSWAVCYAGPGPARPPSPNRDRTIETTDGNTYRQLCALTNPRAGVAHAPQDYHGAQTGDYDLWGVFPPMRAAASFKEQKQVLGALNLKKPKLRFNQRDVVGSSQFVRNFAEFEKEEDEHTGNLSFLIEEIAVRVNAKCMATSAGGWVIHHSDEAGRPMVDEIDCDAVVYFPNGNVWVMENEMDVRRLRRELIRLRYAPLFNPIWNFQLGIHKRQIRQNWLKDKKASSFPVSFT